MANAPAQQQRYRQQRRVRLERRVLHLHLQNNATARAWEINSDHPPAAARSATAARRERLSDLHDACCSISDPTWPVTAVTVLGGQ